MSDITLYGITNCDSVKKARRWLDDAGIDYRFHDFRADGLKAVALQPWVDTLGWEVLLNKRSTTWKQLSDAERADLDTAKATALMLDNPTLIKRPVLVHDGEVRVGFKSDDYKALFA